MKKTKIICTIGPATAHPDIMTQIVNNGMNVARINFSHATMEERVSFLESVKEARKRTGKTVGILYDTKGPDFRTGMLKDNAIDLIEGNQIIITKEDVLGTQDKITVNYKDALDDINVGNVILLEDGLMKLEVVQKNQSELTCKVINGGQLGNKKGVNVPGVKLNVPFLSEQDIEDIRYACQNEGDFLALSFVETKEDLIKVREILAEENRTDMLIISKVENQIGIDNIDDIIEYSDGIMIARGDLGVEVSMIEIPFLQKMMISKCRRQGKFSIVATEMLASMYKNARPTRAEATDIANAVLDGTDVVMLSGETSIGKYPVEAVRYMSEILEYAEQHFEFQNEFNKPDTLSITEMIAKTVAKSAFKLNAKLIIVPVVSGYSARKISNLIPLCPILAVCPSEEVAQKLILNHGVYTTVKEKVSFTEIMDNAKEVAKTFIDVKPKDIIIVAGGFSGNAKTTNLMKIDEV